MKNVLILCTGNSCRSQMAEGLINHDLSGEWFAQSAGTRPAGYVHPLAVESMAEIDIDISNGESKSTESLRGQSFDAVVTVCDSAAEDCPIWLGEGKVVHIPFFDPAKASGSKAEQYTVFRRVRDEIRRDVLQHLQTLSV